jgi:hypothetical protein
MLAADEHRPLRRVEHCRRTGDEVHRQESRTRDVAERDELAERPHVEHRDARVHERFGAFSGHALDETIAGRVELHSPS